MLLARVSVFTIVVVMFMGAGTALSPRPLDGQESTASASFVIRPGDMLKIRVWPDAELGGEYTVEETGFVHLPVLGAVRAGGVEIGALRAELREMYGEALRSPVVSVTPVFGVSVVGAVQRPGLYHLEPTQTVFDAISVAGGFRDNARTDHIRLVRSGGVVEINARGTLELGGDDLALALRSGDRIVVPERRQWSVRDVLWGLQSVALLITLIGRI